MEQIKRTLSACHTLFSDLALIDITPAANKRIKQMIRIIETAGAHIVEIEYPAVATRTFRGMRGGFIP